ncbi:MAG: transcriptional regulator [Deltaproteobacteria bacterium]|nr:transcriptional regulator [Deltaproteobacteria bacterium]
MKPVDLLTKTHPLLADRVRLAIMATLAAVPEPVDFNTLLASLELTKGNLASHVRRLEQAGLIEVHKEFIDRKPRTTYRCTSEGLAEVKNYLEKVETLLTPIQGG